jgi:hypothetical protein
MDLQKSEQQDPRKLFEQAAKNTAIKNQKEMDDPFKKGSTVISAKQLTKTQLKQLENGRISNTNTQTNSIEYNEFDFLKKLKSSNPPNQNMSSYDYQAAAVRRKKQAEIKKLTKEYQILSNDVQKKEDLLKGVKNEIIIRDKQLNNSEEINNFLIFSVISLVFILVLGMKQIVTKNK